MVNLTLTFPEINHSLPMIFVEGTAGNPYLFGMENEQRRINIQPFFISQFLVTQKLWDYVMHSSHTESGKPAVNCSYNSITGEGGFMKKLSHLTNKGLRLPTETEWE